MKTLGTNFVFDETLRIKIVPTTKYSGLKFICVEPSEIKIARVGNIQNQTTLPNLIDQ